jgi:hypothetical protein
LKIYAPHRFKEDLQYQLEALPAKNPSRWTVHFRADTILKFKNKRVLLSVDPQINRKQTFEQEMDVETTSDSHQLPPLPFFFSHLAKYFPIFSTQYFVISVSYLAVILLNFLLPCPIVGHPHGSVAEPCHFA